MSDDTRLTLTTARRVAASALATLALAATGMLGSLPAAEATTSGVSGFASATSSRTNGCFAWWSGKQSSAHCQPATVSGYYRLKTACKLQPDRSSGEVYFRKGSHSDGWARLGCVNSVQNAHISYRG